jgi:hypothetical protein
VSVFKDKTYEGMDWLSQAVEPIHNPLNDFLAQMPDEYIVPQDIIFSSLMRSWQKTLERDVVIAAIYQNMGDKAGKLSWEDRKNLAECFAFQVSDEPVVLTNAGMTGQIKLIKKVGIFEEQDSKRMMARSAYLSINHKDCQPGAIVELGSILFEGSDRKKEFDEATSKAKLSMIMTYVANSVEEDVFKVRSIVAYQNLVTNINEFLLTSSEKCLGRIFKVITMARQGQVTYNVEVDNEKSR